ncbi:MAG: tetratricopeptide repeat protein [Terracidiphilus sp.]
MRAKPRKTAGFVARIAMQAAGSSAGALSSLLIAGCIAALPLIAPGQGTQSAIHARSLIQQHYDAAFRLQQEGNSSQADSEYRLFLAMTMHRMAIGHANLGDYARAASLYEEALRLTPNDQSVQLDYASAALDASDWKKAKSMAASVLDSRKSAAQPPDLRAISALAKSLLELGEIQEALHQFKAGAELHPGFDTDFELAGAYLIVGDHSNAAKILDGLPQRYVDTAALHMKLGSLYGSTKFFDEAIAEFNKALAMEPGLKGVHYSLGATYMMLSGEPSFMKAEAEFFKEIALDPNNSLVYMPLGRIAFAQHRYREAETYFKRAIELNRQSAANYLSLGQLYKETGRIPEAETAFRKAIILTLDPSKNGYEVEQAHFWLGRLLMQDGCSAEGRRELDISRNLLYLKEQQVESRLAGNAFQAALDKTHEADAADLAAEKAIEKQAAAPIASSYDNLGVNAANAGDLASASRYFEHAAEWNPALNNVDRNWGRAAFAARDYEQAVKPLSRVLAQAPEDPHVRAMLGLSLCMIHDYARTLQVLRPIEAKLGANPELAIAYAGSMAMTGDYDQGLARLISFESSNPDLALVHALLGEVYASRKNYGPSADELHIAVRLDPSNMDVRNALALTDVELGEKAEALQLLSQIAESGSKDGGIYFRLAQLQIEAGSAKAAIESMEAAIRLNPMDASYHQELVEAYRRNAQPAEAEREVQHWETLQAQSEFSEQSGTVN